MHIGQRLGLVATLLTACLAIIVSPSFADDYPPCEAFTINGGDFDVVAIDLGLEGQSIGDERLGERVLLNSDGSAIGTLRWVSRVVDVETDRPNYEIALNQLVFELPDGTLHATGQVYYADILDADTQPTDQTSIAVIGGTAAYVKSQGEIITTFLPGERSIYEFRLSCL